MTPAQIMNKLNNCILALEKGNIEIKTLGVKKAKTKMDYSIALRKEILRLKLEKYPATLVGDLARGQEQIASLRVDKDIAESSYYTAISAIENLRIEIEILRSKLRWFREEYHHS